MLRKANGSFTVVAPNLPSSSSTAKVATTYFVNSKLGSGASLAALASLDETSEDYVETLEVKKQKAIEQINAEDSQSIFTCVLHEIVGNTNLAPYSLCDQINLTDQAIVATSNPYARFTLVCETLTGEAVELEVGAREIMEIHADGCQMKASILKAARDKKTRIIAASSEEEIKGIYME